MKQRFEMNIYLDNMDGTIVQYYDDVCIPGVRAIPWMRILECSERINYIKYTVTETPEVMIGFET